MSSFGGQILSTIHIFGSRFEHNPNFWNEFEADHRILDSSLKTIYFMINFWENSDFGDQFLRSLSKDPQNLLLSARFLVLNLISQLPHPHNFDIDVTPLPGK